MCYQLSGWQPLSVTTYKCLHAFRGISSSHTIRSSAEEVIGPARRVCKPWLSTDTIAVLEEKAKAKIQNNTVEHKGLQRVFKARAKNDREVFWNNLRRAGN